jgi:hypothetical protein
MLPKKRLLDSQLISGTVYIFISVLPSIRVFLGFKILWSFCSGIWTKESLSTAVLQAVVRRSVE